MNPAQSRSRRLAEALVDPRSFATTLVTIVVDEFGVEGLGWAAETIVREVEDRFAVTLPEANKARLLAGVFLIGTDEFYKSLPTFIHVCNVLSGDTGDPAQWDPADAAECAWGITEALLLAPPEDDDANPFAEPILRYLGAVCHDEGIDDPPDVLRIAWSAGRGPGVAEWADDPELHRAAHAAQEAKTGEIRRLIRDGLKTVFAQLESLPLEAGDVRGLLGQRGTKTREG